MQKRDDSTTEKEGARVKKWVAAAGLDRTPWYQWSGVVVSREKQRLYLDRKTEEVVTIWSVEESCLQRCDE